MQPVRDITRRGFTLVELIAVAVIVSILAAVAVPAIGSMSTTRRRVATRLIHRDLTFARERALATGIPHWVVFTVGSNTYSVLSEDPANPGRAGAAAITDPATGRPMVQHLNQGEFVGVTLASANFAGATEVGFNWLGQPLATDGEVLDAAGTVSLTGGYTIAVAGLGGLCTWSGP